MAFDEARRLPLPVREVLLDQLLRESRKVLGQQPVRQVGLMSDVVEEDLVSLAKLGAVRLVCGGFIPVDASGEVPTDDPEGQFRLVFENVRDSLARLGTTTDRIISLIVFVRDIGQWALMNRVYRDFITCCPARAAIGIQSLNKTYQIEIVSLVAYRLADT